MTSVAVRGRCTLSTATLLALTALGLIALPGCEREERRFHPPPAATPRSAGPASPLQPGPPVQVLSVPSSFPGQGPYEENAYGVSRGRPCTANSTAPAVTPKVAVEWGRR